MAMTKDAFVAMQREMQEAPAATERARKQNVERFTRMWLSLGAGCIKAAGSSHQEEIA